MKTKLVYLASPYSNKDPAVMETRFQIVQSLTAELLKREVCVFSPIAYSHQFALMGAGGTFESWRKFDIAMLIRCDMLAVLCIDGFNESVGVGLEIESAKMLNIRTKMIVEQPVIETVVNRFNRSDDYEPAHIAVPWIKTKTITWPRIDEIAEALR